MEKDDYFLGNWYTTALQNTRGAHPLETGISPEEVELARRERELSIGSGMCNGFLIHNSRFPGCDDLPSAAEVREWGGNMVFFFRTNDPWNVYRAKESGLPTAEFVEKRVNEILNLMNALPNGKVWWLFGGEQWDSHHPELRPEEYEFNTKEEAFRWFKEWVTTNKHQTHWRGSKYGDNWNPGIPCVFQYLKQKGIRIEELCMGGGGATAMDAHYQHEFGLRMTFVEVFSAGPCTQISIAFCRGAARQYDARWTVYHPPHMHPDPTYKDKRVGFGKGDRVGTLVYDPDMRRVGGQTESMLLRCWIVSHFSGTNIDYMDGAPYVNWIEKGPNQLELTPAGENAQRFADLVLRKRKQRGKTYVPVALLLDFYHGWAPGRASPMRAGKDVTWYKLPFTAGDYMIENFFDAAFPGHSLYRRPRPWKTQEEYGQMLLNGFDMRPYEFKAVTSSTWGDSFDVLLDNAPLDVLRQYPAIVTLGEMNLDSVRLGKLRQYVSDGGILLANAEQIADEGIAEELFGVAFTPDKAQAADAVCGLCGESFDEPSYAYRLVRLNEAAAWAATHDGAPLVTVNEIGKGKALLTTPDYLQAHDPTRQVEAPFDRMAYFYDGLTHPEFSRGLKFNADKTAFLVPYSELLAVGRHTITHLMDELSIVKIRGDSIESIVNTAEDGIIIVLVNNEETPWEGECVLDAPNRKGYTIEEWWEEQDVDHSIEHGKLTLRAQVPAFGFRIYGVGTFP